MSYMDIKTSKLFCGYQKLKLEREKKRKKKKLERDAKQASAGSGYPKNLGYPDLDPSI